MKYLLDLLATRISERPPQIMVVVGAGSGADLNAWRALRPDRLVVMEPQAALAAALRSRLRTGAAETLLQAALVADESTTAPMHVLSNLRESALSAPTGLLEHFPNLSVRRVEEVPVLRLTQVLGGSLAAPGANAAAGAVPEPLQGAGTDGGVLVVEAPAVMSGLIDRCPDVLAGFEWLLVRSGEVSLFDGEPDAAELTAQLEHMGFALLEESPEAISPYVERLFQLQPTGRALWRQRATAVHLQAEVDRLTTALNEQAMLAAQRLAQVEALSADRARLEQEKAELAVEKAALLTSQAELVDEKASLIKTQAELTEEKDALIASLDSQALLAAQRLAQVEALSSEKAQLARERASLSDDKADLIKAQAELIKQKTALQAELVDARQQLDSSRQHQQDLAHRQQLMQEELVKAEAQIELIKDLLLREPSL